MHGDTEKGKISSIASLDVFQSLVRSTVEIDGHAVSDRYFRAEADSYIYHE